MANADFQSADPYLSPAREFESAAAEMTVANRPESIDYLRAAVHLAHSSRIEPARRCCAMFAASPSIALTPEPPLDREQHGWLNLRLRPAAPYRNRSQNEYGKHRRLHNGGPVARPDTPAAVG